MARCAWCEPAGDADVCWGAAWPPSFLWPWPALYGEQLGRGAPPILLADEPGTALDVRHRLELVHALAQRGRTQLVVVVMHDLELAFQCFERILVMAQGRIVLDGGPELALDERLDAHFGVRFERIGTLPQVLLRAQWPLS